MNHEILLQNRIRVSFKKNIRELQPEANMIVKNVPNSIDALAFEKFFLNFGQVFSSRLNINPNLPNGTGYGYVQFEASHSVHKCLLAQKNSILSLLRQVTAHGQVHPVHPLREKRPLNTKNKHLPKEPP